MRTIREEDLMATLYMFHGRDCPHCRNMMPRVEKLEEEAGIFFDKREVWHDEGNQDLMRSHRAVLAPKCGGQLRVPTFFNPDTGDVLCGEVEYETLKEWAEKQ